MQRKIVAAAVSMACLTALPVLAQQSNTSTVQLWGIVDAGIRHTNNEGANRGNKTQMVGGGMSQSRWGIKVEEDLGSGTKALVELENRFTTDDGASPVGNTPFFQLANIGLQGSFGKLTMGRQWNVLFDVVTSTYASFPYSTYMEVFKPELGMAAGARSSNSLKYVAATADRKFAGGLQYSFHEGGKFNTARFGTLAPADRGAYISGLAAALEQKGAFLRFSSNGFSLGGAYLRTDLPGGSKLDAWTAGGSYRADKLYLNLGYAENKVKYATPIIAAGGANLLPDQGVISGYWAGGSNGGFQPGDANKRQMAKLGVGYQVTPRVNMGVHYYHAKQKGSTSGAFNGKSDFIVALANYQFSKRTDAYLGVDHIKLSGGAGMAIENTASTGGVRVLKRTGITTGIRHRF